MGWTRNSGTVVSLAVLASVVANYAVHRHFELRSQRLIVANEPSPGALIFDAPNVSPDELRDLRALAPRTLEDLELTAPDSLITPALQTVEANDGGAQNAPKPVPVPQDAVPIDENTAESEPRSRESLDHQAVRLVIEDELADSSREERDIWYDELKSLPAGVVRDLLQVRKQLRALPRALHKGDPPAVAAPRVAELPAEPVSQTRRQTLPDWASSATALEQACTIARHNLANAMTPGFKRLRVTLVDSYGAGWRSDSDDSGVPSPTTLNAVQVEGCRLGEMLLDAKDGVLENTGRSLDLAIIGDGFFVATRNEKTVYSRCGAMTLDAQRRVCLAMADGNVLLEPVITIPMNVKEIQISAAGAVMAVGKANEEPAAIGKLTLARFASPAKLRPIGGTLLVPTEGSGPAEIGEPDKEGCGTIEQGFLELSNVDAEEELANIEQWRQLLQSFPTINRPFTASGKEGNSH